MKTISKMMKKWKNFSQLGRTLSCSSVAAKPESDELMWEERAFGDHGGEREVFVGSSRKRYAISTKHLTHPLLNALIDRSRRDANGMITVPCEVVLFDHLLWMLENADPDSVDSMDELVELYACC